MEPQEDNFNGHGAVKLGEDKEPGCVFCNVNEDRGFDILSQDSDLIVFRDHDPAAAEHLLVIPVMHITSVKDLKREHVPLLKAMERAAHSALDSLPVRFSLESRRLGFHIPPVNSVMHLHLHVHGLPYKSAYRQMKYPVVPGTNGRTKGYSWFVEIQQAIDILERNGEIGLQSC